MSQFEKNTSKLLQKCTESDKNNYTIAFEGSLNSSQEFNGLSQQKRSNYMSNEENDKKMTKSEHLIRCVHKTQNNERINRNLNHRSDLLVEEIDESIAKLTQSIPDIKALLKLNGNYRMPYTPVSGLIPLYDLQSSQSSNSHSSSSEFSPPRSLVKMFMQSRSPLSSQPISPSFSFESKSQDSGAGNASDLSFRPLYYNILELSREANNNILLENKTVSAAKDDSPLFDDNICKNRNRFESHRIPFDLKQTFPIKEVDENMWDSNNTDIQMNSIDANDTNGNEFNKTPLKSNTRNCFNPNDISNNAFEKYSNRESLEKTQMMSDLNSNPFETQFNSRFKTRNIDIRNNRKSNQKNYSLATNMRTTSTQFPTYFHDKEVQASIPSDVNQMPTNMTPMMTPESPNDCNKPFYVYYPNYSLPDLSFLEQILEKHSNCGPKAVYLSPTKHQLPNKESIGVKMRRTTKSKSRPKSYTDFETLSKQNFSHIKDWDSLNILLPNEFKELIQKANNISNVDKQKRNENIFNDCNPNVRMRAHRSNTQLSDNSLYSRRGYVRNKRYSLQEYPSSQPFETQTDCHNISHNSQNSCITRSQTMPNCQNSCHCHQHCCHSCCHSCCRTPRQSPSSSSANKSFVQSSNFDVNTNSIDKLCQLLAMDLSFKKLMNIINGPTVLPHKRSNFETVAETKEEKYLESDINSNKNNSISEESSKRLSTNPLPNGEGFRFQELKQRWESLAALSPTDGKTTTLSNTSIDKNNLNSLENSKRVEIEGQKVRPKPEIARKPQVVLRRPQSSIPRPTSLNTENPIYSHRKSFIPVPKAGIKSPVNYTPKLKTNIGSKNSKL